MAFSCGFEMNIFLFIGGFGIKESGESNPGCVVEEEPDVPVLSGNGMARRCRWMRCWWMEIPVDGNTNGW